MGVLPLVGVRRRRHGAAVALAVMMSLVAAGCGSTDANGEADTSGPTESEEPAGSDQPFYEGKTIEITVPFGPGGSSDVTSRIVAKYLQKHIEGNPTVQVVNVEANGAFLVGSNDYAAADPDGMRLFFSSGSVHTSYIYDAPGVEYDLSSYDSLIGFPLGVVMFVSSDTGITNAEELRDSDEDLFFGVQRVTGGDVNRMLSFEFLGLDHVKPLVGYESRSALQVAFEQGEVNFAGETTAAYVASVQRLVDAGEANPIYTLGFVQDGELVADPLFPELPHVGQLYEEWFGEDPSALGTAWEGYKMQLAASMGLSKALWIHGDAPQEARDELHRALEAVVQDPDFIADTEEDLGGAVPLIGDDLSRNIDTNLNNLDPEAIEWLRKWVGDNFGEELG